MKARRIRSAFFCAAVLASLVFLQGFISLGHAADVKELLKQINSELRQAERDMFGGKSEQAIASLEKLKEKIRLAKEAIKFLQKENENFAAEKGSEVSKVLAVSITGPWRVFKKNILGEPIQYNLPIATAVQKESEKAQNLARVYFSTLLTQEMKGVEMGPPFTGVIMGDSYYIRPKAIK